MKLRRTDLSKSRRLASRGKRTRRLEFQSLERRVLMAADVYTDSVAEGWNLWEWDAIRDPNNSSPVAEGAASLSVNYQQAWGGVILDAVETRPVDADDVLQFQVHGGSGGQDFALFFIDGNEQWQFAQSFSPQAEQWQNFEVNLASTTGIGEISGFAFQEWSGSPASTIYFDAISLSAVPDDGSNPGGPGGDPGSQVAVVYDEALVGAWQNWSWETTVDEQSTSEVANGQYAMSAAYQSQYAGLYLRMTEELRTGEFNQVELSLHGGAGGQNINLNVMDGDNTVIFAFNVVLESNEWNRYIIELDAIGDPSLLNGITLQNNSGPVGEAFYIDDVTLTYREPDGGVAGMGPIITIDPTQVLGRIEDKVYGLNFADAALAADIALPIERWGGNSTSRYNYLLDSWNAGSDWFFLNIGGEVADPAELPAGSSVNRMIAENQQLGADTLITVGMTGYVSNSRDKAGGFAVDKYGPQQSVEPWDNNIGNGVRPDGSFVTGNDPLDVSIEAGPEFAKQWVEYLTATFGIAAEGGVQYYALDNEPMLWHSTHRDVHPEPASYAEVLEKGIAYATAIKEADSTALVTGPAPFGWTSYFYSALDAAAGGAWWENPQDRNANGGMAFLPWYLEEMAAAEQAAGQRLLDVLDIHYYPQDAGVALTRDGGSLQTQQARLQSTRSLWDPNYVDPTWINEDVQLVPRMQDWINNHYPGTQLAITEYNFGGIDHISGALVQAAVLGIFGREGVDIATMWGPPNSGDIASNAFRMYRNYDGQGTSGSRFGEISLGAMTTDVDEVSAFASMRESDGAVTVMLINKSTEPLATTLALPAALAGTAAERYTYSQADLSQILRGEDLVLGGEASSIELPGYSITLLEFEGASDDNQAPVANNDAYSLTENQTLLVGANEGLLANDVDPDQDPLTAVLVAGPDSGSLTLNADGSFSYTPVSGFVGSDFFTYIANDGTADSLVATVGLEVAAAPVVNEMSWLVMDNSRRFHQYDLAGNEDSSFRVDLANRRARGMAVSDDGSTIWTINLDGTVFVYDRAGTELGSWQTTGLQYPEGLTLDGDDIYIVDRGTDSMHLFAKSTQHRTGQHAETSSWKLDVGNRTPFDVVTDGAHLWVVNNAREIDRVFVYDLDGTPVGSWVIDSDNSRPTGIALDRNDPNHLWIVDVQADSVFRYADGALRAGGEQAADAVFALADLNRSPQAIALTTAEETWTNLRLAADVNNDKYVSPIDALMLINYINGQNGLTGEGESRLLSAASRFSDDPFYDVNGDGQVSPIDALLVINWLNLASTELADEESVDAFFFDLGDNPFDDEEEEFYADDIPLLA